jgi:hypothetical protein
MKRDCGKGELIPIKWVVVSCFGQSDDEIESKYDSLGAAQIEFNRIAKGLVNCSDVRLYAKDKQGYMNCVLSIMITLKGERFEKNRLNELY